MRTQSDVFEKEDDRHRSARRQRQCYAFEGDRTVALSSGDVCCWIVFDRVKLRRSRDHAGNPFIVSNANPSAKRAQLQSALATKSLIQTDAVRCSMWRALLQRLCYHGELRSARFGLHLSEQHSIYTQDLF